MSGNGSSNWRNRIARKSGVPSSGQQGHAQHVAQPASPAGLWTERRVHRGWPCGQSRPLTWESSQGILGPRRSTARQHEQGNPGVRQGQQNAEEVSPAGWDVNTLRCADGDTKCNNPTLVRAGCGIRSGARSGIPLGVTGKIPGTRLGCIQAQARMLPRQVLKAPVQVHNAGLLASRCISFRFVKACSSGQSSASRARRQASGGTLVPRLPLVRPVGRVAVQQGAIARTTYMNHGPANIASRLMSSSWAAATSSERPVSSGSE